MSTATIPHRSVPATAPTNHGYKLSFLGVLRSEWMKFWSLRSSWIVVPLTYILAVGPSIALTYALRNEIGTGKELLDTIYSLLSLSAGLSGLIVIAYSVTIVTNEWSTGSIYSTVTAVPRRTPTFFAKLIVSSFITILVHTLAYLTILANLSYIGDTGSFWSDKDTWLLMLIQIVGILFYSVLATFIAYLLRNTALSMVILYAFVTVVQSILTVLALQFEWMRNIVKVLPSSLVQAINEFVISSAEQAPPGGDSSIPVPDLTLSANWSAFTMVIWVVFFGVLAWVTLKRRDI
ncbi:ABC transporter permease subunit [Boudabousia marimammalium]|uniref:Uncharacterized protein n=1 Tax=Boudabousia marimammalium TaxID=156892 RepID=A0A1Q5PRY9_9ACTO|nr:ABC transporter permease subunit [Boudabousia marimammalium]OKL50269.1 hypothetical protein BM477_02445 [Boudabousia marimammalium]